MHRFPTDFKQRDGVWVSGLCAESLDYSDGAESETYLAEVLGNARDLTSDSDELVAAVRDWPSRYHLGKERANLLRGLDIRPDARVLELGAGCGALTRFLGERCREVVAVEGSLPRARLARSRCRDLDNIEVVAGNLHDVQFENRFDIVTVIGVLEYAAMFGPKDGNPFAELLLHARECLAPGGVLILAIENKLGLKYLSGCAEDHTDRPFSGIEGYPDGAGPRTFGRVELQELLTGCGFTDSRLVLPFPDYKVPDVLIEASHTGADEARIYNLSDWCRTEWEQYGSERYHLFSDHLALQSFSRNGLLADVANSFLFLASPGPLGIRSPVPPPTWIARGYNEWRAPAFRTELTLEPRESGAVLLKRQAGDPAATPDPRLTHQPKAEVAYIEQTTSLASLMLRSLRRSHGQEEELGRLVRVWVQWLRAHGKGHGAATRLPGRFLDCVPFNLLVDPAGELHYIDDEWVWNEDVSLGWVLTRGLHTFWARYRHWFAGEEPQTQEDLKRFVVLFAGLGEIEMSLVDVESCLERESEFQAIVSGKSVPTPA